jgi:hypothetical protein
MDQVKRGKRLVTSTRLLAHEEWLPAAAGAPGAVLLVFARRAGHPFQEQRRPLSREVLPERDHHQSCTPTPAAGRAPSPAIGPGSATMYVAWLTSSDTFHLAGHGIVAAGVKGREPPGRDHLRQAPAKVTIMSARRRGTSWRSRNGQC